MKKLFAGLLAAVLLATPAFAEEDVWDGLENRYYEEIPQTYSSVEERFLEEGDTLDWNRAVRRYISDDQLGTQTGVESFLTALRSGEALADRITYNDRILVYVEGASGSDGMAVVNPQKNEIVGYHPGDNGEMFVMKLTDGVKSALENSEINLSQTKSYNLCLNGLCYGILYTDGKVELFQPICAVPSFMSEDTAYTVDQLADIVEENADLLTQYEGINANLDPEKANVITGANPLLFGREEKPNQNLDPEKPNVVTGR